MVRSSQAGENGATPGVRADWRVPFVRAGWHGMWDRVFGPGATRSEQALVLGAAAVAAAAVTLYAATVPLDWRWYETLLAALLAFDLVGGVVAHATPSSKRWVHRPGQRARHHFAFLAAHGVHVVVVAGIFVPAEAAPLYLVLVLGFLLLAGGITLASPIGLRRSVALLSTCVAVGLAAWVLPPVAGLEWFLPVLALKLIVGHLVVEAPFVD